MIITLTPEDVIKRCLWLEYKKFVLKDKNEKEIEELVKKNEPFTLNEEDAYVIGLLKIVETDNLVHRFKLHINNLLEDRSTVQEIKKNKKSEKRVLINKSILLRECLSFKDRFPHYYLADKMYQKNIEELKTYVNDKYKKLEKLETVVLTLNIGGQSKKITYLFSNEVSKLVKLNTPN
jgi:hypothetical protein